MAQITLDIKESRVSFFLELIKNFDFVKVNKENLDEPTKEEIKDNIEQGLEELKLIEEGKMKTRTAKEFLDEL